MRHTKGFPDGPMVKNPPAMQEPQETQVQSLAWEYPLEECMATHSSILAWENSMDRGAWWAIVHRVTKSRTRLKRLSTHAYDIQNPRLLGREMDKRYDTSHADSDTGHRKTGQRGCREAFLRR